MYNIVQEVRDVTFTHNYYCFLFGLYTYFSIIGCESPIVTAYQTTL